MISINNDVLQFESADDKLEHQRTTGHINYSQQRQGDAEGGEFPSLVKSHNFVSC